MRLYEILNTKANISWNHNGQEYTGDFTYGNINFTIILQVKYVSIENNEYTIVHVGFGINDGQGNLFMDMSGLSGKEALKVLSIVSNGVYDKLQGNQIEFIIMGTTSKSDKEHQTRLNIYNTIAKKFGTGWDIHKNIPTNEGTAILMASPNIDTSITDKITSFLSNNSIK